jgi:hypothetical protein
MCPPVPPAAISSRIVVPGSLLHGFAGDRQQDADAAKLMMSDEPPALMNGSVMPVIGTRVTTTPMLMNAWRHSQAGDPGCQQRPEGVGGGERGAHAGVASTRNSTITAPAR